MKKNLNAWKKKSSLLLASLCAILTAQLTQAAYPLNQQTGLKVLLLSADGTESTTAAWETTLKQEGVPYDKIVLSTYHAGNNTLTNSSLGNFTTGTTPTCTSTNYQAVVIATGGLVYDTGGGNYVSALSTNEWAALNSFEASCGIRQITAYAYPSADYGLNTPTAGLDLGGKTASLTAAGKTAFPYLRGTVPIDLYSWGYLSTPVSTTNFATYLTGPNNSALVGVFTHPDKRQEMVMTVAQNPYQMHSILLRHGMLSWVTQGVYLGYSRNYLEVHVDDIFLPDDVWDTAANVTSTTKSARMSGFDVIDLVKWQHINGFTFDLYFNAAGSVEATVPDALTLILMQYKKQFFWGNHTYTHQTMDNMNDPGIPIVLASVADISAEIVNNLNFAKTNALPNFNPTELVTGEHSGLYNNYLAPPGYQPPWPGNPNMGAALEKTGILWTGSNNSVYPNPYILPCTAQTENAAPFSNTFTYIPASGPVVITGVTIYPGTSIGDADLTNPIDTSKGPASVVCNKPTPMYAAPVWAVPRYPTNVYYNAATQAQQLDEYNYLYLPPSLGGGCVNTATTTCFSAPVTWAQYVTATGAQILTHVLQNDPKPHFMHQTNFVGGAKKAVAYPVMNNVLTTYKKYISSNAKLMHLSLSQIGLLLYQNSRWSQLWKLNVVQGYIQNGKVTLINSSTRTVSFPVTGVLGGTSYGGQLSGWTTVPVGQTTLTTSP